MRTLHLSIHLLRDQQGVALPMALLALLILSSLVISFALLATSEPLIATNQKMVAQARAVTESGLERAIWALNLGISDPLDPDALTAMPASAPYDGNTPIPISVNGIQIGVVFVTVTAGTNPNERNVVAVGWAPTNTGSGAKAHQKIQATVYRFLYRATPPPASLTVQGQINITGNTNIDSRDDVSCGAKDGTWSVGSTTVGGSGDVYGADFPDGSGGNNTADQSELSGITDVKQNVSPSAFDPYLLKNQDLNSLKAMAKAAGTYYSGAVTFNAGNPLPNGIIFVDTLSGQNIDVNGPNTTSTSDFASVQLHGNAPADPSGIFRGMIVVAGGLSISGDFHGRGLVYAVNDLVYQGTGTGLIEGAVISQNIRDVDSTTIDTNTGGNSSIIFNCGYASNPTGQMPQGFTVQPGSYKEVSGS
jgi:hypothetical protein